MAARGGCGQVVEVADGDAVDGLKVGPGAAGGGGPQREQRGGAGVGGDAAAELPYAGVEFGSGDDQDLGPGEPGQGGDVLGAQAGVDRRGDARGLRAEDGLEH